MLCWFNSFGYGDDEWNASVLETFANATSPGGVVLINTLSAAHIAEYLEGRVHEEVTPTTDGAIVERSSFDVVEQRLVTVRSRAGSPESSGVVASVRLYDDRAWTVMLERAGFTDVSFEPRLMPTNADAEFEVTVVATRR